MAEKKEPRVRFRFRRDHQHDAERILRQQRTTREQIGDAVSRSIAAVYGTRAVHGSMMHNPTTALDFGQGNVVICEGRVRDISRLVLDGEDVRIHLRTIAYFDLHGRPVYEPIAYDFGERKRSVTIKLTVDSRAFVRDLRRVQRRFTWFEFTINHKHLARIILATLRTLARVRELLSSSIRRFTT